MYLIENENELLKKLYKVAESKKLTPITNDNDVILQLLFLRKKKIEYFVALYLDNANQIIKKTTSRGTVNYSAVYPREIAKTALLCNANSVIIAHNHPGGNLTFSHTDIKITGIIKDGLKLFDIELLDHIIICETGHASAKKILNILL